MTTPFAVLLNNDATPEPDWLERLLAPFDEPGAERLAAVSSKVVFAAALPAAAAARPRASPPARATRASSGVKLASVIVDGARRHRAACCPSG